MSAAEWCLHHDTKVACSVVGLNMMAVMALIFLKWIPFSPPHDEVLMDYCWPFWYNFPCWRKSRPCCRWPAAGQCYHHHVWHPPDTTYHCTVVWTTPSDTARRCTAFLGFPIPIHNISISNSNIMHRFVCEADLQILMCPSVWHDRKTQTIDCMI